MWNITHFNELKKTDLAYCELQSHCIKPWIDPHSEDQLVVALKIADKLNGVYAALAFERLYKATKNQPKTTQKEHKGAIAGCLQTFLDSNS